MQIRGCITFCTVATNAAAYGRRNSTRKSFSKYPYFLESVAVKWSADDERRYLSINPDVRKAVEAGVYDSGYEHYMHDGRHEGRKLDRFSDPDRLHFLRDYTALVNRLLDEHPDDHDLAMSKAIGSVSLESFRVTGDKHVDVLRNLCGLVNGMGIFDLGCGCGRTAQALTRQGWQGHYRGQDIIPQLIDYARKKTPGFRFDTFLDYSLCADDSSQDIVFAWSLFTHLNLEEIALYMEDCHRVLKPGGKLVFSFLELVEPGHKELLEARITRLRSGLQLDHLDTFLHRETIRFLAERSGFSIDFYKDASDTAVTSTGSFGQSLVVLTKPCIS